MRGQSIPHCPECGTEFESIDALVQASYRTNRLKQRVQRWHRPLDVVVILSGVTAYLLKDSTDPARLLMQLSLVVLGACGLIAIGLLFQVIRWMRDPLIPREHREDLVSAASWLAILTLPLLLVILAIVVGFV